MLQRRISRIIRKERFWACKSKCSIANLWKFEELPVSSIQKRWFCEKPKDYGGKDESSKECLKEEVKQTKTEPEKSENIPDSRRMPMNWKMLRIYAVIGVCVVSVYSYLKQQKKSKIIEQTSRSYGKPALGGQWTLVDHNGFPFTDASLNQGGDKFALLYFGFTFCPDICPAELIKMKRIIERLDKDPEFKELVIPVFISVDPHRDGVAQVRHYIKDFHERTIGLTGTVEQVSEACKRFRVYHSIADRDLEEEDDYVVDHSIVMYLIGPDGNFMDFYTQLTEVGEAVKRIKNQIRNCEESVDEELVEDLSESKEEAA